MPEEVRIPVTMSNQHYYLLWISPRMLRSLGILLCLGVSLLLVSGYASAHPPTDLALSQNAGTGELTLQITHPVQDPFTHFIRHVTIRQGGTVLVDNSYTRQPGTGSFVYTLPVPGLQESGGPVTADVECNIFGSRSVTFEPGNAPEGMDSGAGVPSPTRAAGVIPVALLAAGIAAIGRARE